MDNPHTLHHCASTSTLLMLHLQLPSDSTTLHIPPHIHKYHNNAFPSSSIDTASNTPLTPQHIAVSIALHPNIGNVVLPLLLPRRASPPTATCSTSHHHNFHHSRTHAVHNPLPLPIHERHTIQPAYYVPLTNVRTSALHYRLWEIFSDEFVCHSNAIYLLGRGSNSLRPKMGQVGFTSRIRNVCGALPLRRPHLWAQ